MMHAVDLTSDSRGMRSGEPQESGEGTRRTNDPSCMLAPQQVTIESGNLEIFAISKCKFVQTRICETYHMSSSATAFCTRQ